MYLEERYSEMTDSEVLNRYKDFDSCFYSAQLIILKELEKRKLISEEKLKNHYQEINDKQEKGKKLKLQKEKKELNFDIYIMVLWLALFPMVCLISIMGYSMMKMYYGIEGIYSSDIIMGIAFSFTLSIILSVVFNNASNFVGYLIINLFLYIALIHPCEYMIDYAFSNKNIIEISSQVVEVYTGNMGRNYSRIYSYNARVRGEDENYYSVEINKENYNKFNNNLYFEKNKIDFKVKLYISRGLFGHTVLRKYSIE